MARVLVHLPCDWVVAENCNVKIVGIVYSLILKGEIFNPPRLVPKLHSVNTSESEDSISDEGSTWSFLDKEIEDGSLQEVPDSPEDVGPAFLRKSSKGKKVKFKCITDSVGLFKNTKGRPKSNKTKKIQG